MSEYNDMNAAIIDEFRANSGRVGGNFEGRLLLLLHSMGAKSGQERIAPVVYRTVGDSYAIFASKGGAPTNPAWYHNLVANPTASIEIGTETGTETVPVVARVVTGDERTAIWEPQREQFPTFAEYEKRTTREIPVVLLSPA